MWESDIHLRWLYKETERSSEYELVGRSECGSKINNSWIIFIGL